MASCHAAGRVLPLLAYILLGVDVQITVNTTIDAFKDYVSTYNKSLVL